MIRLALVSIWSLVIATPSFGATPVTQNHPQAPVATQWVLDAVGPTGRAAVRDVYLVVCPNTEQKGTGFLVDNGVIVTNEHVVRGCNSADIFAVSSFGNQIVFTGVRTDAARDLAALNPATPLTGGLKLGSTAKLAVGNIVRTWGHPLGYNGPPPLLSVGYLSGFRAYSLSNATQVKHLVVNAAFNSGNSGGPLFAGDGHLVVGVVVSKALPLFTPFVQSAVQAFSNNKSGVVFTGTGPDGKPISMVESQVVAELVASLRDMAQVMIGEAIAVEELIDFLKYKSSPR